ncbi:MAG: hypothetical protein AB7N91_23145 [Candidatus Tectimicrobiota bacterium]
MRRYLAVMLAVLSVFALVGCSSDDDDEAVFDLTNASVPASSATVAAVQGQAITIPAGTVFNAGAAAVNLTFNSATTATISRTGSTSSNATVTFASCTFVVQAGGFITAGTYSFPTCNFLITANDVVQGGGSVTGTLTLFLSGPTGSVTSSPINIPVTIRTDGVILINNVVTPVDVDSGTGTSGVTGG